MRSRHIASMQQYERGQNLDAELAQWYVQLVQDGDLGKLLGSSLWSLGAFLEHFRSCSFLLYEADADGRWWYVSWLFPFMYGGTWGVWFRADYRSRGLSARHRVGMQHIRESLRQAFEIFPVLINTTKQPDVVAKTVKLGYTYLGEIPLLFDGESCHVLHLTRQRFEADNARWERY